MAFGRDDSAERLKFTAATCDREINELLLSGQAQTMSEAENQFLDAHLSELAEWLDSLTDEQAASDEVVRLLLSHGSRPWEDSLW
jgi:hypothetical protein